MRFEVYDDVLGVKEASWLALKHRLYIPGWSLYDVFRKAIVRPENYAISLCFSDEEIPIGVGVIEKVEPWPGAKKWIQVFVRKSQRRQGIGRQIVERLVKIVPDFEWGIGMKGSRDFWNEVTNKKRRIHD